MASKLLSIENAKLLFKNFSGKESKYNRAGDRNFCVIIPEDVADQLRLDGWNVKMTRPRDEFEEPQPYIKVKVSYRFAEKSPKIYRVVGRKLIPMYEDTIAELDWANIVSCDLDISASHYEFGGQAGVSGYLANMWVTIEESRFTDKYNFDNDPEDVPFN